MTEPIRRNHFGQTLMLWSLTPGILFNTDRITNAAEESESPTFEEQTLFQSGTEGYYCYRIPSLLMTKHGTILAFAEARKLGCRDHGDIDLVVKRSFDSGKTWSSMQVIADDGNHTMGNPCPVVDRSTGTIWLPCCRTNREILVMKSTDDGKTWLETVNIKVQTANPAWHWLGTGPGHGIQLSNGRLVIPCWADATPNLGEIQQSFALYSDDAGASWTAGTALESNMSDECEVVELEDRSLYMNARSRQGKHQRAYAFSQNGGETWSPIKFDPTLPEPSCQGALVRFTDTNRFERSRILLSSPAAQNTRSHMTVRLSYDECQSWPVSKIVHEGSSAYSDLTVSADRHILLLYEVDKSSSLTLARFNIQWLTDGTDNLRPSRRP
ncbi:MAG: glycoside hydrolase [Fuerstiella sp.]|nr:glycoside hydrolase [Fuerstiella sp.]